MLSLHRAALAAALVAMASLASGCLLDPSALEPLGAGAASTTTTATADGGAGGQSGGTTTSPTGSGGAGGTNGAGGTTTTTATPPPDCVVDTDCNADAATPCIEPACDAAGKCITKFAGTDKQCGDQANLCWKGATCLEGQCQPKDGTPIADMPGNCVALVCQGGQPTVITNEQDKPSGKECNQAVCDSSTPGYTPADEGADCGFINAGNCCNGTCCLKVGEQCCSGGACCPTGLGFACCSDGNCKPAVLCL
jgi:hypothetical protein